LRQAIRSGDEAAMRRIKGVGPKTAQRMLLELRDKIAREGVESGSNLDYPTTPNEGLEAGAIPVSVGIQHNKTEEEALMALVALGFPKNQMEKVLSRLIQQAVQEGAPIVRADELVKRALRSV
jgi:Holliday junction DNA helicase RuvA